MPNVIDNEELYNVITLNGVSSPGRVTLSGHNRKHVWDVKGGPSLNGATTTLKQTPPIEFSASFYLVIDPSQGVDDYTAWDQFVPIINATIANGRTPRAVDIYHPDLAENDIKSVCKAEVGGRVYDGMGGCTIVVKFQEYRPPKKQGGTPLGSTNKAKDPNADLKAQIDALTAQYAKTPWG